MNDLVARTKITPPRRTDLYSRPRLLELLDELAPSKLIILVAAAGYGKTYTLVDFIQHTKLAVCWYAVDVLDRDTHRFFSHLIASISQRYPAFGPAAQAALQSMSNGQITLDQFVITVVNELYECVDEEYLIIVDDYHLVEENETIGAFFSQFVQQSDERCHVLLASRRLLALPDMPLLVARGYVVGLDFEDLVFEPQEVQELMLQNYGQTLQDNEVAELVKATEGWITGLLLSAQSQMRNVTERMRRLRAAGVDLYDYLAQQVLNQQPADLRTFLLRTSAFDEFDAALCQAVLGEEWLPAGESWSNLIEQVLRRNLFAVSAGETGEAVRYHNLFHDFLQKILFREQPEEEMVILRRLAEIYRQQGEWEKAHRCYRRLHDLDGIADLLEEAGLSLLQRGRTLLLAEWFDYLPGDLLQTRPQLLSLKGDVLARRGEAHQALELLNAAEAQLRSARAVVPLARTLIRRTVVHRLLGNYPASLDDADSALELIAQQPGSVFETTAETAPVEAHGLLCKGLSLHLMGQFGASIRCMRKALDIYQALGDTQNTATVSMELAMVYASSGQHANALELFQYCLGALRRLANISSQAIALNNLGVLYHAQGNYVQAVSSLADAYDCAQRSGYTRFLVFALASLGDLFADLEMWSTARNAYQQALSIAHRINERFLLVYLELALAKLTGAVGDWREAFEHLNEASQMVLDKKSGYEWALYQLAMGQYYLAQGKAAEALEPLQDALSQFAQGGQPIEEATTLCFLAATYQANGQEALMVDHLTRALSVAGALESNHPFVVVLRHLKETFTPASFANPLKSQLQHLSSQVESFEQQIPMLSRKLRQTAAPALASLLANARPRLSICALGRAEVFLDGKLITTREWQTQVSRDILFCLLTHAEGLTREEVGAIFWQDAPPDVVKTRFKNAVYRMRGALSSNVLLFDDEIYRFNFGFDYEYDVENFLRKVEEGETAENEQLRIAAYSAAIQFYRGPFLPELDGVWVWVERERLHQIFTETVLTLTELQLEAGDHRGALRTCQRALSDDRCMEEAHRLAMRIYAAMGNRPAVARQYAQCEQALREEIDVPPSPQTEHLYSLLMHA